MKGWLPIVDGILLSNGTLSCSRGYTLPAHNDPDNGETVSVVAYLWCRAPPVNITNRGRLLHVSFRLLSASLSGRVSPTN